MSNLSMTQTEEKAIDSKIEQMMDWAQRRQIEAEQLALDSARLMGCTTDRLDRLSKQGFFKRCWSQFNGDASALDRANVNDVIQMQKMGFRYVNMLQDQQLLMAHSLLSLKNNLNSLAVKEEETRNLIAMLAQRTLQRFEELEGRVGKLETSSNLHDWLFTLEEREYEEKIPTDYMRLLRIINDFYGIKNDNWNNNDLMFMRKAIRTVGLNPKEKLSINTFIDKLADEIQSSEVGFEAYDKAITMFAPDGMENYSQFAIENVSSPVFASLHGLNTQYRDRLDVVEALQDDLGCSQSDALKKLLRQSVQRMNVNLDYEFPLAETAIEILGCMRLSNNIYHLTSINLKDTAKVDKYENKSIQLDINNQIEDEFKILTENLNNCQKELGDAEKELDTIFDSARDIYNEVENRPNGGLFGIALSIFNKNDDIFRKNEIVTRITTSRKNILSIYKKCDSYLPKIYEILIKNGFEPDMIDTFPLEYELRIDSSVDNYDWLYTKIEDAIEESRLSKQFHSLTAQWYKLLANLKQENENSVSKKSTVGDNISGKAPAQIIDGIKGFERYVDVIKEIANSQYPLDRNSSFLNTPKGRLGNVPAHFQHIVNKYGVPMTPDDVVMFLSDGKSGFFVTSRDYDALGYICTYDLPKNIFSIADPEMLDKIVDTEAVAALEKKYGGSPEEILGESMQKFQKKALETFPELETMFG